MPHIAPIPWKQFERFVRKHGYVQHKTKSGHLSYKRQGDNRPVIIPTSHREMRVGEICSCLKTMRIETQQYLEEIGKA